MGSVDGPGEFGASDAAGAVGEPGATDLEAWFAELDRYVDVPFMEDGRRQPPMAENERQFD